MSTCPEAEGTESSRVGTSVTIPRSAVIALALLKQGSGGVQAMVFLLPLLIWILITLVQLANLVRPDLDVGTLGLLANIWLVTLLAFWTRTFQFAEWLYAWVLEGGAGRVVGAVAGFVGCLIGLNVALFFGLEPALCWAQRWRPGPGSCSVVAEDALFFAYLVTIIAVLSAIIMSSGYVFLASQRLQPGRQRVLAAIAATRRPRGRVRISATPGHWRAVRLSLLGMGLGMPVNVYAFSNLPWFREATTPLLEQDVDARSALLIAQWLILFGLAAFLAYLLAAALRPGARAALASPDTRCVLFLRSFAERRLPRLERACALALARHGVFLAVGDPREMAPGLSGLRTYEPDDQWQATVEAFLRRSSVVVVVAGDTPGLRWELQTIQRLGLVSRTLIVFPRPDAAVNEHYLAIACAELGILGPPSSVVERDLRAATFGDESEPLRFALAGTSSTAMELAVYVAAASLRRDGDDDFNTPHSRSP